MYDIIILPVMQFTFNQVPLMELDPNYITKN